MSENISAPAEPAGRVLIIVENLPVPFDRRVWQEATTLRAAGYEVSVISPKGKGYDKSQEVLDGINIYRHALPLEASGALGYLVEYASALAAELFLSFRVLRRHGFDIIHACNPPDLIFLVALVHKVFFGKKFLFDQHDINPELYEVKFGKRGVFHRLLNFFERCTFRCADGSLATNETLKKRAVSLRGMPADKVWTVRSFPDLEKFKRTAPDRRIKVRHKYLIGYVGIMAEQDGVEILVRAMAHIVNKQGRDDVKCLIIGDGPDYDRLRSMAKELELNEHIQFTGYQTGEALMSGLSACDIGVIPDPPNACNDKLSMNKVFEYMALGLPFVQFNLEQAKIEAGEAAHVVDEVTPEGMANGILELLGNEGARQRMSAYATQRAQREFHWKVEKHSLLEAYRTLLQEDAAETKAASPRMS